MTADVTIKGGAQLQAHPLRAAVLSEVHARPFTAVETPCRLLHFAFHTGPEAAQGDRKALAAVGYEVALEDRDGGDEAAGWFSAVTGTECRLVALCTPDARRLELVSAQAMSFADATPVLVANEASLRDLARRAVEPFGMDRFRANLVVDGVEPWDEDTWASFTIGEARLETVIPVPRCTVPQVDQDTGKRHKEPARALRAHRWCTGAPSLAGDSADSRVLQDFAILRA